MQKRHEHLHGESVKKLKAVFFLNLTFTCIEIIGGFLTGSMAIISDALHDLGDSVSLGLSWMFERLSAKRRTKAYTYGYRRFSLLGGLITAIMLIVGSVFILAEAVKRILAPVEVYASGMLALAVLGLAVNGAAVLKIKGGKKITERLVFIHLLEDVLGWGAVLIVSIIMQFTYLPILDPLLSLCIAVFVLSKIYPQLKTILNVFLQHAPSDFNEKKILRLIKKIEAVKSIHDLHVWTLDGQYHVATLHVVVQRNLSIEKSITTKEKVRSVLLAQGIDHLTIELESEDEECQNCDVL
jgi:cobalt-zinc-cadmium efflux system protein